MSVIYHLQYFYALWSFLHFRLWRASLSLQPKYSFLIRLSETQITGQHRPLQVIYVHLTETYIGPAWWWLRKKDTHPYHVRSHCQFKTKYVLLWKAYGHKTWQGSNLWWGELAYDVKWPSEYVVTGQFESLISPISQSLLPPSLTEQWHVSSFLSAMITKLCRAATYDKLNSPIRSRDFLTTYLRDKLKTKYLLFHIACGYQIWQDGDL